MHSHACYLGMQQIGLRLCSSLSIRRFCREITSKVGRPRYPGVKHVNEMSEALYCLHRERACGIDSVNIGASCMAVMHWLVALWYNNKVIQYL